MKAKHLALTILGIVYTFLTYKFWTVIDPIKSIDKTGLEEILTFFYWFSVIIIVSFILLVLCVALEDLHTKSKRKISEVIIGLIILGSILYLLLTYFYWNTVHVYSGPENAFYSICWLFYWGSSVFSVYWFINSFFSFMEKKDRWNKRLW